ncbi:hypothetical protein B0H19DRAFT_98435 [Mycena capillaripes]|nr:hypothetical protein B0H19DRAFT_98435 [Mycena capillaripes]
MLVHKRTESGYLPGSGKYPVLTLPSEIVSEIFTHFLPIYPLCPPLFGRRSPTALTQICRKWRQIAVSTPVLWRAIRLPCENISPGLEREGHIAGIWLARSHCCPLSIYIGEDGVHTPEAFAAVFPHRARWEYLKIRLSVSALPATFNGPMPLLRHLDLFLGVGGPDDGHSPRACNTAFCEAPLLRIAFLHTSALHFTLPWAQLTSLTLNMVYPDEWYSILQQTSRLVHCNLNFDIVYAHPIPDIALPCLESLAFKAEWAVSALGYLGAFIVPALRSLRIPERFLMPNPIDSLKSFVSKSGCELQRLHIVGEGVTGHAYHEAFPSILELTSGRGSDNGEDSEVESDSDVLDSDLGR